MFPLAKLHPAASAKLFIFGSTIGPVVDSFHNQCLLRYKVAPINISWPDALPQLSKVFEQEYLLCSSWSVPLLLGFAYVVLGDVLPRLFQWAIDLTVPRWLFDSVVPPPSSPKRKDEHNISVLRNKAIAAILTTCLIIKISQYLELHEPFSSVTSFLPFAETSREANYVFLMSTALLQWLILDRTIPALLAAAVTSIGGPLSELPFVANGVWEYIPQASDYIPFANFDDNFGLLRTILGENYQELALSSITGPCYFAVTMDSIALGRWFQKCSERDEYHP